MLHLQLLKRLYIYATILQERSDPVINWRSIYSFEPWHAIQSNLVIAASSALLNFARTLAASCRIGEVCLWKFSLLETQIGMGDQDSNTARSSSTMWCDFSIFVPH